MIRVKKCETIGFDPSKSCPGFLYVTLHCWPWAYSSFPPAQAAVPFVICRKTDGRSRSVARTVFGMSCAVVCSCRRQQSVRKLQNKMALLCCEIVVRGRSCNLREESFLVESCSSETFFPPSYEHLGSVM